MLEPELMLAWIDPHRAARDMVDREHAIDQDAHLVHVRTVLSNGKDDSWLNLLELIEPPGTVFLDADGAACSRASHQIAAGKAKLLRGARALGSLIRRGARDLLFCFFAVCRRSGEPGPWNGHRQ